jgi:predicted nucleic acid-binding protein
MIVADASLLANYLNPLAPANEAEAVYRKDADWHAPSLWRSELQNTLLKYLRAGMLTVGQAEAIMEDAAAVVGTREQGASNAQVLGTAMLYKISAYDAEYVATAQVLGVPLVTFDKKLVRAAPGIALSPEDFLR